MTKTGFGRKKSGCRRVWHGGCRTPHAAHIEPQIAEVRAGGFGTGGCRTPHAAHIEPQIAEVRASGFGTAGCRTPALPVVPFDLSLGLLRPRASDHSNRGHQRVSRAIFGSPFLTATESTGSLLQASPEPPCRRTHARERFRAAA